MPGETLSPEQLEHMTKEYQKQIRTSPLWDEIVRKFGKEKTEELLAKIKHFISKNLPHNKLLLSYLSLNYFFWLDKYKFRVKARKKVAIFLIAMLIFPKQKSNSLSVDY
ncbi:MAG: hypothetical protein A3G93_01630 [Nitrospinae bacterium RIFCSPLOWO2_12_FULL_45_22]|nr:MAG: hypothetical protein A3G93_01630 [Nitrospinae bacterium RIFCSPLOWO2_12_FULL_45_22]